MTAPDWGLADGSRTGRAGYERRITATGTAASWRAALAITLHRYDTDAANPVLDEGEFGFGPETTVADLLAGPTRTDRPAQAALRLEVPAPSEVPLAVTVSPGEVLRIDYRSDHYSPAVIAGFAACLTHVHAQVVAGPAQPVSEVDLCDEEERRRIIELGRPATPLVSDPVRIPEAFARSVAANPAAIAIRDGEVSLTYAELDARSAELASGLWALGVRDGDRVGVCLDRSAELVVTLLAVLKAGATYVPTDPAYPADRIAYTAQDAGLAIVVTRLAGFPEVSGTRTVTPDELAAKVTGELPAPTGTPDDPAYIIYTSGSTGRPKGVVVPHRNVISLVDATRGDYRLGPADAWSLFHSSAFDVSVYEMWGCLLTGGRLVVVPYFVSRDPELFRDLLVAERVTVLSQTPSAFSQLLHVDHAALTTRLVIFAGEPLDARMLLPWFDRHPETECRMVNMFGITETTVHTTVETVTRAMAEAASKSVGPALPGWCLYVLDQQGRLVPPGVTGEIYVGGAGVALHYLNRPDLTGQRFLPDRFTGSGRMYRSGDLGRLRPDGRLEHLGRMDNQVKIRGFRIELDEIRAVLLEDPAVRAAAVLVRRADPADPASARLDAYVVLTGEPDRAVTAALRARAAGILPEYMVPATITAVPSFPLTTNGKLDAAKLPEPVLTSAPAAEATPTEDDELAAGLRAVWGDVFGVPVGLDDDFFELGGNSLFAVRIGTALRDRGLPAPRLRDLYRAPTVRALVSTLSR